MNGRFFGTRCTGTKVAWALLAVLLLTSTSRAQEELRADRKVAYESGRNTLTIKSAPGGKYYVLNRDDRCVWVFSSPGNTMLRQISSVGTGPSDLLLPRDLAVDPDGNAIVADASDTVKIFSSEGKLLNSFPFKRPHHVAVLSDGRILVSGFPTDSLMSVFDKQGRPLGSIGTPAKLDRNDNIYYVFQHMFPPTIRKYSRDGTMTAEWRVEGGDELAETVARAKASYDEQKSRVGAFGGVGVLTGAAFDEGTATLWVGSGRLVMQLDSSGHTRRMINLTTPDGRGAVQAEGLDFEPGLMRVCDWKGVFEFPRP